MSTTPIHGTGTPPSSMQWSQEADGMEDPHASGHEPGSGESGETGDADVPLRMRTIPDARDTFIPPRRFAGIPGSVERPAGEGAQSGGSTSAQSRDAIPPRDGGSHHEGSRVRADGPPGRDGPGSGRGDAPGAGRGDGMPQHGGSTRPGRTDGAMDGYAHRGGPAGSPMHPGHATSPRGEGVGGSTTWGDFARGGLPAGHPVLGIVGSIARPLLGVLGDGARSAPLGHVQPTDPALPLHAAGVDSGVAQRPAASTLVDTARQAPLPAPAGGQPPPIPGHPTPAAMPAPQGSGQQANAMPHAANPPGTANPMSAGTRGPQLQAGTNAGSPSISSTTHAASPTPTATARVGGDHPVALPASATAQGRGTGVQDIAMSPNLAASARTQGGTDIATMSNMQAAFASNAARNVASPALQAIQPGTLTLAFVPPALSGDEPAEASRAALFRGQDVEGHENLRDIFGRSYVFSADGRLVTRAEEQREIDPVQSTAAEAIDADHVANHGELSTHELIWRIAVPAFAGVGSLLGGVAAGAAATAGSTGMSGGLLLTAAIGILGYGTVRATNALRAMAAAGESIHPLENRRAGAQWLAAGTQGAGSLASLALLLL